VQSGRRFPPSRLPSSVPLHIIRRFTQYWRNDYVGTEQWSRFTTDSDYAFHRALFQQHVSFAKVWDRNLRSQGFAEAFERQRQTQNA